jgi:hypothetical protein
MKPKQISCGHRKQHEYTYKLAEVEVCLCSMCEEHLLISMTEQKIKEDKFQVVVNKVLEDRIEKLTDMLLKVEKKVK